jgi:hypothetical protein
MRSWRVLVAVAAKLRGAFLPIGSRAFAVVVLLALCVAPSGVAAELPDGEYAHAYEFEPDFAQADDIPPWERSGLVLSVGFGNAYSGLGGQLAYEWLNTCTGLGLAAYAAAGVIPGGRGRHAEAAFAVGALGSYGARNRWLLDLALAPLTEETLGLGGAVAAERVLYGPTLQLGRQWMGHRGMFFRVLVGAGMTIDRYVSSAAYVAFGLGAGWKP